MLAVLLSAACADQERSPERQIEATIEALQEAVEAGALVDAAEYVHDDYRDARHRDKGAAMRTLYAYLRRHREVHLFSLVESVTVVPDADEAGAIVFVAMTGVPAESLETLVSLKADLYRFDLQLRRQDTRWRVSQARWERADPRALF